MTACRTVGLGLANEPDRSILGVQSREGCRYVCDLEPGDQVTAFGDMLVIVNPDLPPRTIAFAQDGKIVGAVINVDI